MERGPLYGTIDHGSLLGWHVVAILMFLSILKLVFFFRKGETEKKRAFCVGRGETFLNLEIKN